MGAANHDDARTRAEMSSGSSSRVSPGRYLTGQSAPQRVSGAGSPGGRLAGHGDVVFASLLLQQDSEHLRLVAGLVRTPPRHRAPVPPLQVPDRKDDV